MKKLTIQTLWALVCVVFILSACQKESGNVNQEETTAKENQSLRTMGFVQDDLSNLAGKPSLVSAEFKNNIIMAVQAGRGGGGQGKGDKDADGIPDASDACPTQKETVNGYQDSDGCPDTAPQTSLDSDGDGIANTNDACPTQAEN